MSDIKQVVTDIVTSPKVGIATGGATATSGVWTLLEWIPTDIGKLATLVGIVLTVILIRVHYLNMKKAAIELEMLKEERDRKRLEDKAAEG